MGYNYVSLKVRKKSKKVQEMEEFEEAERTKAQKKSKTTPEQAKLKSPPEPPRINPAVQPPGIDCPSCYSSRGIHNTFPHFKDNSRAGHPEVPTGASQDESRCSATRYQLSLVL